MLRQLNENRIQALVVCGRGSTLRRKAVINLWSGSESIMARQVRGGVIGLQLNLRLSLRLSGIRMGLLLCEDIICSCANHIDTGLWLFDNFKP
jgi:hypothetical protein